MKNEEIVKALRELKVETGSLVCMGCGREHDCGILGCRIVREAAELIARFPAADVVPVVRCKDSKHKGWVQEPCHGKSVDCCKIWDCTLRNLEATFCSYGEPKDGGASNG